MLPLGCVGYLNKHCEIYEKEKEKESGKGKRRKPDDTDPMKRLRFWEEQESCNIEKMNFFEMDCVCHKTNTKDNVIHFQEKKKIMLTFFELHRRFESRGISFNNFFQCYKTSNVLS